MMIANWTNACLFLMSMLLRYDGTVSKQMPEMGMANIQQWGG